MRVFPEAARRGDLRMRRAGAVTIHPNRTARSRTDTPSMTEIPGQRLCSPCFACFARRTASIPIGARSLSLHVSWRTDHQPLLGPHDRAGDGRRVRQQSLAGAARARERHDQDARHAAVYGPAPAPTGKRGRRRSKENHGCAASRRSPTPPSLRRSRSPAPTAGSGPLTSTRSCACGTRRSTPGP